MAFQCSITVCRSCGRGRVGGWEDARFVDHVLCKLPFEEAWYRERGCNATFVGHPYFDQLRAEQLDAKFISELKAGDGPLVAILPGSRTQEVKSNLEYFLKAAKLVRRARAECAVCDCVVQREPGGIRSRRRLPAADLPAEVHVSRTAEIIEAADCAMAVSGSVSLELLYHDEADGDSVLHFAVRVLCADVLPEGAIYHAREPADGDGFVSEEGRDVRSEGSGRRPCADAGVSDLSG